MWAPEQACFSRPTSPTLCLSVCLSPTRPLMGLDKKKRTALILPTFPLRSTLKLHGRAAA